MDRHNFYWPQPLKREELNALEAAAETSIRKGLAETKVFGIVSGLVAGLTGDDDLNVAVTEGVAYDSNGKRIATSGSTTQDISETTDGDPTEVVGAANERWVSVCAVAGYNFTTTKTDGDGNTVKANAYECLNALGSSNVTQLPWNTGGNDKNAGVGKFNVIVADEAPLGTASRPDIPADGVLICDVRLVFGTTALGGSSIYVDRTQRYSRPSKRDDDIVDNMHRGDETSGAFSPALVSQGSIKPPSVVRDGSALVITVGEGIHYTRLGASALPGESDLVRYAHGASEVVFVQPDATDDRQDLICVDQFGRVFAVTGTPGELSPSDVPENCISIFEVRVLAGTTDTNDWPMARTTHKFAPYPFVGMAGIVSGCGLEWSAVDPSSASSVMSIPTRSNGDHKALFHDGTLVSFPGGASCKVVQDAHVGRNPFGSAADANYSRAYYVYLCKNQFGADDDQGSPVILVETTIPPSTLVKGQANVALTGPRGEIEPVDTLFVGNGWVYANTTNRAPCKMEGEWVWAPSVEVISKDFPATTGTITETVTVESAPVNASEVLGTARYEELSGATIGNTITWEITQADAEITRLIQASFDVIVQTATFKTSFGQANMRLDAKEVKWILATFGACSGDAVFKPHAFRHGVQRISQW